MRQARQPREVKPTEDELPFCFNDPLVTWNQGVSAFWFREPRENAPKHSQQHIWLLGWDDAKAGYES